VPGALRDEGIRKVQGMGAGGGEGGLNGLALFEIEDGQTEKVGEGIEQVGSGDGLGGLEDPDRFEEDKERDEKRGALALGTQELFPNESRLGGIVVDEKTDKDIGVDCGHAPLSRLRSRMAWSMSSGESGV